MNVGEIRMFMELLGVARISVGSRWVRSTCPLNHLHSGGIDKQPSFAISINPDDKSNCNCQACGYKGDLLALLWRKLADRRRVRAELVDFLVTHNKLDLDRFEDEPPELKKGDLAGRLRRARKYVPREYTPREYAPHKARKSNFVHPDDEPQAEVPESTIKKMIADMPEKVRSYLTREPNKGLGIKGRNLNLETVVDWELGWHPLQRRICIPIRDEGGKLVAISGRKFDDDMKGPKYMHSRFKRDRVLFGEHRHVKEIRVGYLFEGFYQVMFTSQLGYKNALARMGTHLSRQQTEKLVNWFDHVIIVPDGDKAGRDSAERIAHDLSVLMFTTVTGMPRGKDADTLNPAELIELLGPPITA